MAVTDVIPARVVVPGIVRRNTLLLAVVQCMGWLGVQMIATLGSITAYELTGDGRWAGMPVTLSILSAALAAPHAGRLMDRLGRRPVLMAGQIADGAGSAVAGVSILYGSFAGFLLGITIRGIGIAATALSRSAAADMYPASRRAQGMSVVVMGGAVGAIGGPLLLAGLSTLAGAGTDLSSLALPWLVMALPSLIGLASLLAIRPDPRDIASNLGLYYPGEEISGTPGQTAAPARPLASILRQYPAAAAIGSIALVQGGMVMLMVTASLQMKLHGHGDAVYGVMSGHFLGMLGFALLIGRAADRLGRRPVLLGGALLFTAGAITAPLFTNPLYNGASLFLVGLGWSLCYVAANAVLADMARPNERGRLLGTNDLVIGLVGAVASLVGGLLLGGMGFLVVGAIGLVLGVVPFVLALRLREPGPGHYA